MHHIGIRKLENACVVFSDISKEKQVFVLSHDVKFKDWAADGAIIELTTSDRDRGR